MPRYRYQALTPAGDTLEGEMEARAAEAVAERIHALGYFPLRVESASSGQGWGSTRTSGRVRQEDLAMVTRELATLLRAGLPLDRALAIVVELSTQPAIRDLFSEIRQDVRGGASLHAAMEARRGVFSRFYLNMIRAGEAGGALGAVMTRLTEFMERARELNETVKSALIYPAILLVVALISVFVLLIHVVPQFTQMFEDTGKALPWATQVVIGVGEFLRQWWWAGLGLILAGQVLMRRILAHPVYGLAWDAQVLTLPLIGDLLAKIEMARFSRTLGTLLNNGVSLLAALSIVRDTLGNRHMAERLGKVAAQLREGKGFGQSLLEADVFPRLGVHMVMVGEETGRLSEMLIQTADVFDREVKVTVKRALGLLEPAMILFLGLVIGGIIMSILVAILSVNELAI